MNEAIKLRIAQVTHKTMIQDMYSIAETWPEKYQEFLADESAQRTVKQKNRGMPRAAAIAFAFKEFLERGQ